MGNALEFILKIQDMLTPGMRQAARISDTASAQIQNQFERIQGSGRRMSASVDELRSRLEAVNRVRFSTTIEREFNIATRAAQRLESQINRMENRGAAGGGLMSQIGGLIPGIGLGAGIGKAITGSADAEMSKRAFGTMLQDSGKGNALYADINKFATDTVFDNAGVIKNAQTLLSFGTAGDKIMPTLKMLGDVSMGDQQHMESLTLAYAQMGSAGKLAGQDLLQFVNAGFNPLNEISKMTGISMADLKKQMEKGAITSDMVTKAFQHATAQGGMFHNALANAATTVQGKWGNLMGTIQTKLVALGDWLQPATKWVIDFFSALIENGPALGMIAGGIGLIAVATGGWSAAQAVLNFVMNMNPIIRIISLILILSGIIYGICRQYDGWGKSMQGVWEIIKGVTFHIGYSFKDMGQNIWYWIQYAWLKTKDFVEWIGGAMNNVFHALELAAKFDFAGAKTALTATITTSATKELADLEKSHQAGQAANQQALTAAMQQIANGKSMIGLKKTADSGSAGVNPITATGAGGDLSITGLDGGAKSKADHINSGGQRSIIINIGKQIEKLEVHVMDAKDGVNEIESMVREAMRRVMYSLNGVAPN